MAVPLLVEGVPARRERSHFPETMDLPTLMKQLPITSPLAGACATMCMSLCVPDGMLIARDAEIKGA